MTSDNWVLSHVLIGHFFIFFCDIPVPLFCPFLIGYIILLSCKRSYCILDTSLASFWRTISLTCSQFFPSWITSVGSQIPWNEVAQAGYGVVHASRNGSLWPITSEDRGLSTTKWINLEVDSPAPVEPGYDSRSSGELDCTLKRDSEPKPPSYASPRLWTIRNCVRL